MEKYIGIDISKATLDVYDGEKSYKFDNSKDGFNQIKKLISKEEDLCLIYEPTGVYYYPLVEYCQKHNIKSVIVGSKEARDYARSIKQRSKTDKIDAKVLYRYHTQVDKNKVTVPSLDTRIKKITQRRNVINQYQKAIASLKNLIEATSKDDHKLIGSLKKKIASLESEVLKLNKETEELITKNKSTKETLKNLQTIPGVGKKSALAILLEFMRYPDASSSKIAALMGLDPVLKESGIYRGKSRISKQGGKQLRTALYMPMLSAIKYNDRLKDFYERLVSKGKPKKLAIIAAMRKLVRIAYAVAKNNEPYRALA